MDNDKFDVLHKPSEFSVVCSLGFREFRVKSQKHGYTLY